MKKIGIFILLSVVLMLSGCFYEIEYNSLDDYKETITNSTIGYSDLGLDQPKYFLPSNTFLDDYEYLEGNYFFYDRSAFSDLFLDKSVPSRALIVLRYDAKKYDEAKECVLNNIPQYEDYFYTYNGYQFYVNKNLTDPRVPEWFTMVCYNDENNVICFLGFHNSYPPLDDKYLNDLDNHWESFIDEYYGEYYDFSQ